MAAREVPSTVWCARPVVSAMRGVTIVPPPMPCGGVGGRLAGLMYCEWSKCIVLLYCCTVVLLYLHRTGCVEGGGQPVLKC